MEEGDGRIPEDGRREMSVGKLHRWTRAGLAHVVRGARAQVCVCIPVHVGTCWFCFFLIEYVCAPFESVLCECLCVCVCLCSNMFGCVKECRNKSACLIPVYS